ncbi:MAG: hypothetical protein ACP5D1_06370 [Bacteroidales bacterium]
MNVIKRYYFIVLAFFPYIEIVFSEFIGIDFPNLFGTIGILLVIIFVYSSDKYLIPKYFLPLLLLSLYYLVWDIINGTFVNLGGQEIFLYIFRSKWLHTLAYLFLIENTFFDEKFIKTILIIFKATIIIAFIVSIIQFFVDPYFLMPEKIKLAYMGRGQYELRLNSIFGYLSTTEVGNSFIPIISIIIGYYLYLKKKLNITWLLMAGFVVFANKSRYLYVNFLLIIIQYPLVNGMNISKVIKISIILFTSFIGFLYFAQIIGFDVNTFIQERLFSKTASTRLLAVELFLEFFPKNPFFGTGELVTQDLLWAIRGRSSHIHVGYLSHLFAFGIVGTIFLVWFLYDLGIKLYKTSKETMYYGTLFAFLCILFTNLTGTNFGFYHYGLLLAFIVDKYINDKEIEK